MIRVIGLSVEHGSVCAVDDVSLHVARGTTTTLLGLNGAGKTSLIMAIARLLPTASGEIEIDGRRIGALPRHALSGIGLVPEGRILAPTLTVSETLRLGARGLSARQFAGREAEIFDQFPMLSGLRSQRAGTLSGGQAQMLALARALVGRPRILLVDEPTPGLSPAMAADVARHLRDLKQQGLTMLISDQSIGVAAEVADRIAVMRGGRLVAEGDAAKMRGSNSIHDLIFN